MLKNITFEKNLSHEKTVEVSSLSLAFLGDGVWSLLVRNFFCERTSFKNNLLHTLTTKFVKASYQALALDKIQNILTEQEVDVARRARNAKLNTVSKNASLQDYKKATSFEAILGYDYLKHDFERIETIFEFLKCDMMNVLEERNRK
ncbi:MAG: Mini-ribonuclease 3 [Clostridia bacterium]|nr:Mini-ribonuclease 3 [Clostridia bacterium]